MKAAVAQQLSLLELSKLDAELSRIAHRASHLPQQEAYARMQSEHNAASDRLATVRIAVEDLDAQVSRLESEVEAVRQREDRDRTLLKSGAADAKQLSDLQHELETLVRRQTSLEDQLLEVMERREELETELAVEQRAIAGHAHEGAAEFVMIGGFHLAAKLGGHGLLAIADAEKRHGEVE